MEQLIISHIIYTCTDHWINNIHTCTAHVSSLYDEVISCLIPTRQRKSSLQHFNTCTGNKQQHQISSILDLEPVQNNNKNLSVLTLRSKIFTGTVKHRRLLQNHHHSSICAVGNGVNFRNSLVILPCIASYLSIELVPAILAQCARSCTPDTRPT